MEASGTELIVSVKLVVVGFGPEICIPLETEDLGEPEKHGIAAEVRRAGHETPSGEIELLKIGRRQTGLSDRCVAGRRSVQRRPRD